VNVYSFLHVAACVLDFYPFIQIQNVLFRREMVKRGGVSLGFDESPRSNQARRVFYQL